MDCTNRSESAASARLGQLATTPAFNTMLQNSVALTVILMGYLESDIALWTPMDIPMSEMTVRGGIKREQKGTAFALGK
jgi:hypothetical protein